MSRRLNDYEPHTAPLTARAGGICPLCTTYIAKGRSRVLPLPVPLVPTLAQVMYDPRRGWRERTGAGRSIRVNARTWAHEHCVRRHWRDTEGQDQDQLATERLRVLLAHKRAQETS